MAEGCLAARVRKVSRIVNAVFDEELSHLDLNASRLTLLSAIAVTPNIRASRLAKALAIEKSTMSRNLSGLEQDGLITVAVDGRDRRLKLTPAGQSLVETARPSWNRAQERAREILGPLADALLERYPNPGDP